MTYVLRYRWSIAHKEYLCDSCLRRIHIGQRYYLQISVNSGEFQVYRAHDACERATQIVASYLDHNDELPRVCDMEQEDRETILADDPEAFAFIWGDA